MPSITGFPDPPADHHMGDHHTADWALRFQESQGAHHITYGVDEEGRPVISRKRIPYGEEMRELKPGLPEKYTIGVARLTRYVQPEECHDCGVPKGFYHLLGCDDEECPMCHWQLISCDCWCDGEE